MSDLYRRIGQGSIQEDWCRMYTGRLGVGRIQEDRCRMYTGMDKLVHKRSRRGSGATRQLTDEWS